jgi:uncharacterized membrane protein YsdA (DUF1294 family)
VEPLHAFWARYAPYPLYAAIAYAAMSLVALALYGFDKRRAESGGRRVRERTLHLVELLGGWPGALIAMRLFRHKTRKLSFLLVTWTIVAAHAAALWLLWRSR